MFTGIVQAVGTVVKFEQSVLAVRAPGTFAPSGFELGESIAINGVCLTVVQDSQALLSFDLSPETVHRSNLGELKPGDPVNLERAMSADGRFGGHIVQGHVDATGTVVSIRSEGEFSVFRFQAPVEYDCYLIDKGSITIDGISLTVVEPVDGQFDVWIIPHTIDQTNLCAKRAGGKVNLEFDVIAKYVEKMLKR